MFCRDIRLQIQITQCNQITDTARACDLYNFIVQINGCVLEGKRTFSADQLGRDRQGPNIGNILSGQRRQCCQGINTQVGIHVQFNGWRNGTRYPFRCQFNGSKVGINRDRSDTVVDKECSLIENCAQT